MPPTPLVKQWVSKSFQLFFHLLYHQLAWAYDVVAWMVSLGRWKAWVMSILPSVQGSKVLEIGHGPGHLLLALKEARFQVVGLDESRRMSGFAVLRLLRSGFDSVCVNGYAQLLPFPNRHFDTICATFPSEYILNPATLAEAYRVLVPGGRLLILPSAWFIKEYPPGRLINWLFGLTGERSYHNDAYAKPLLASGFLVSTEVHRVASSETLIIQAKKPEIS